MKKLYSYYIDYGRSGNLEGLFIAEESELKKILGKEIYFGEILGKHSEVTYTFDESDFNVLSEDQYKIEWLESLLGSSVSGYNPLDYFEDSKWIPIEEDEDEEWI